MGTPLLYVNVVLCAGEIHCHSSDGGMILQSRLAAASSARITTSRCSCKTDAGTAGVTGPVIDRQRISALPWPEAISRIFFALRMLPAPIVIAWVGTSSSEAKKRELA